MFVKNIENNPPCVQDKKQGIIDDVLQLESSSTMSSHCDSPLSMVIGLLQIIIAMDYIISLSN